MSGRAFNPRKRTNPRRSRNARPRRTLRGLLRLEGLEDRTLLASNISITDITVGAGSAVSSVSGSLTPGQQTQIDRFDAVPGETVDFTNTAASSTSANWEIVGPDGTAIAGQSTLTSELKSVLPVSGSYELVFTGTPNSAALTYTFQVVATAPTPQALSTNFGQSQSGTLAAGTSQSYQFTAPAGEAVFLDIQNYPTSASLFTLTGPGNSTIPSEYASGGTAPLSLPASGSYTLTVSNGSNASGAYQFRLQDLTHLLTLR